MAESAENKCFDKKRIKQDALLMNMVKITRKNGDVVVLDKKKKYGWEGYTFPGGKVEPNESILQSVYREAKEETGLDIQDPKFCGIIHWFDEEEPNLRLIGFLYEATTDQDQLITGNEGNLFWCDYQKFCSMTKNMSDSMHEILDIYNGKCTEIIRKYRDSVCIEEKRF